MTEQGTEKLSAADTESRPVTGVAPMRGATSKVTEAVNTVFPPGVFMTTDHRYYLNGEGPVPSVTTVIGIMDKPAVMTWKAKESARAALRAYAELALSGQPSTEEDAIRWAVREADKARDTAAKIGSGVHLLADMASRGQESDPKAFQVSEQEEPYLRAFRGFLDRYSASSIVSSEKAVWSLNGYAGTYDLLMQIQKPLSDPGVTELWLIDIKTSKGVYSEYGLQLAGYRWADSIILPNDPRQYPMPEIHRTGILHLRPDKYPDTGWRLYDYPTSYTEDYLPFLGLLEAYKWKESKRHRSPNAEPLNPL